MTMFWLAVLSLLLSIFIFVFVPPRRRGRSTTVPSVTQANVHAYRLQLAELESELREHRIAPEQFERDRDEIEERLAMDLRASGGQERRSGSTDGSAATVYWMGLVVLLAALLLYFAIGAPPWTGPPGRRARAVDGHQSLD